MLILKKSADSASMTAEIDLLLCMPFWADDQNLYIPMASELTEGLLTLVPNIVDSIEIYGSQDVWVRKIF